MPEGYDARRTVADAPIRASSAATAPSATSSGSHVFPSCITSGIASPTYAVRSFSCAALHGSPGAAAAPFGFDDVAARAHKLAEKQYEAPKVQVPEWLGKITYDQWRDIRFRPDQALWHEKALPFRAQFFHPGLYYDHT